MFLILSGSSMRDQTLLDLDPAVYLWRVTGLCLTLLRLDMESMIYGKNLEHKSLLLCPIKCLKLSNYLIIYLYCSIYLCIIYYLYIFPIYYFKNPPHLDSFMNFKCMGFIVYYYYHYLFIYVSYILSIIIYILHVTVYSMFALYCMFSYFIRFQMRLYLLSFFILPSLI